MAISEKTTLLELATIIAEALAAQGIVATLSGGAAVSIYSKNRYQSADLDFVTTALIDDLKAVLEPLGFKHSGMSLNHLSRPCYWSRINTTKLTGKSSIIG